MEMQSLRDLYLDELRDLYSAENQILKALPKMAKAASDRDLERAFNKHLRQTEGHVKRLDRIFKQLDESPRGKKCVGMEGLIKEGQELIKEKPDAEVLDAGLIAAAQRVEHYEMAGYGTVRTYAQLLGEDQQAELLQQTLDEEGETDKLLTQLAESSINLEAEEAEGDEMEMAGASSSRRGASRGRRAERELPRSTQRETTGTRGRSGSRSTRTADEVIGTF
jgi:ferritin-like metal-binding protein YciE